MPLIENTRTSRITGPDSIPAPTMTDLNKRAPFPGGAVIIQPAEIRGEGRETKIIPTRTELSLERFEHALRDSSLRKLFKHKVLFALDAKGNRVPYPEEDDAELSVPREATVPVVQQLHTVTEDQARELLKRFPHLVAAPVVQTGNAAPAGETAPAGDGETQKDAPAAQPQQGNQRPQGNGNQRR